MRVAHTFARVALCGVALYTSACTDLTKPGPTQSNPPRYRPLTTPWAPIYNLVAAYSLNDSTSFVQYPSLFADTYEFIWHDPKAPGVESRYGRDDEIATSALFIDPEARIALDMLDVAADTLGEESNVLGDPPGARRLAVNGIRLAADIGVTTYLTTGGAEFTVAPTNAAGGKTQWRIIRWRDLTAPPVAATPSLLPVAPATWGLIKAIYLPGWLSAQAARR